MECIAESLSILETPLQVKVRLFVRLKRLYRLIEGASAGSKLGPFTVKTTVAKEDE